jgi:capsular exopolysaccharide synthesis family protein
MSEEVIENKRTRIKISPKELIFRYMHFLPLVILSISVALIGAYIKLRYSTPIYSISGKLLVSSQSPYGGGGGGDKFDDIFMMQQRVDKLNDEIEIIKSRNMAARVIRSLGMQKQVYSVGKIRTSIIYPGAVPFNFEILSITDTAAGFSLGITFINDTQFRLNEQPKKHFYNETINLPNVSFRITSNGNDRHIFASNDYLVAWNPAEKIAPGLSASINVGRVNEATNVLNLSYTTENPQLGVDVVNRYMREYQVANMEDKKQIAARTLEFIDEQLDTVFLELGGVEKNLQKYREKNKVYSPEAQTQIFLDEYSKGNKDQAEMQVKLKVTDYLISYLSDEKNRHNVIPSTLGIEEPALLQQVTELNKLQLERETALKNTPGNNPRIINMESAIEKLRLDMVETLKNVRHTQVLAIEELSGKRSETSRAISSIPSKEKQLLEVTRQQNILQELYQYLLQKKLETAIASASTISNIKVLEPALSSGAPISPNRKGMYIIAVFIGLALPVGIIFLLEFLDDKVKGKNDVQQGTDAPILGEIGHADGGEGALVVTRNNRKIVAEQFRMVRSNLQYIIPKVEKPVLLVTSSFSGEGKSFISTNLGSVLAISGKRTVILEFDIRKPKIMKGLGLNERKGITNYIVGSAGFNEIIHQVPDVENLFVISCGPVPPNPAEMLLHRRVDELFQELRKQFDAIIIDSAPVGLVSDAMSLGRYADGTIYIVRHKYTLKKQLQMIDDIYRQSKLPHVAIVINDINSRGGYGGYYGYGSYGYGYGYGVNGNGSGYFDSGTSDKKRWRKLLPGSSKKSK